MIAELLDKNANQVKGDKRLLSLFMAEYKTMYGKGCPTCGYAGKFAKWQRDYRVANNLNTQYKTIIMASSENTFKLKNPKMGRATGDRDENGVPVYLRADSPDSVAMGYLKEKGFVNTEAREALFTVTPKGYKGSLGDGTEITEPSGDPWNEMTLKEMREAYPDITATSKKDFRAQLNGSKQENE